MFLFRAAVVVSIAIMLMPTDEATQTDLAQKAVATSRNAQTFCERQPHTCAAGAELWDTFKRKSEYALSLSVRLVADYMRGPGTAEPRGRYEPAQHPAQGHAIAPAARSPAALAPTPVPLGSAPARGTLTPRDSSPSWRGNLARNPA